jgi:hypothetical protein
MIRSHDVEFAVGDWVWLRLHQRSAVGITDRDRGKLAPRYYGPFQVLERIGAVAYRLQLPAKARIHDVFHVAFLNKHEGDLPQALVALPNLAHCRVLPTPEKILYAPPTPDSWEVLIPWVGRSAAEASWEALILSRNAIQLSSSRTSFSVRWVEVLWAHSLAISLGAGRSPRRRLRSR